MHAQVRGEAASIRERHGADVTAVGLLPRMRAQVLGEAALRRERLGADVAAVGLLPRMCAQVLGEAATNRKRLGVDVQIGVEFLTPVWMQAEAQFQPNSGAHGYGHRVVVRQCMHR
jgi:hypothetical protein